MCLLPWLQCLVVVATVLDTCVYCHGFRARQWGLQYLIPVSIAMVSDLGSGGYSGVTGDDSDIDLDVDGDVSEMFGCGQYPC